MKTKINQDENFLLEVAKAVVTESHPAWSWEYQGRYFADPVEGKVFFRESNASWNPWSDEANFRIVPVSEMVHHEGNDFDPSPSEGEYEEEAEDLAIEFALREIKDELN